MIMGMSYKETDFLVIVAGTSQLCLFTELNQPNDIRWARQCDSESDDNDKSASTTNSRLSHPAADSRGHSPRPSGLNAKVRFSFPTCTYSRVVFEKLFCCC